MIGNYLFSQSSNTLDDKNGFKEFKFGQNIKEFDSISFKVYEDDNTDPILLEYNGKKYNELFGYEWFNLRFAFCDSKLFTIEIDFDFSSDTKYNSILESLEKLFGKSYSAGYSQLKGNNFKRYNSWEDGKKVFMYIRYLGEDYPRNKQCETCKIQLVIGSDFIEKQCLKNDF